MEDFIREHAFLSMSIAIAIILMGIVFAFGDIFQFLIYEDSNPVVNQKEYGLIIDLDKTESYGSDVIGFIRYFKDNSDVTVIVSNLSGNHTYVSQTYVESNFKIEYSDKYTVSYNYEGKNLIQINCIKQ